MHQQRCYYLHIPKKRSFHLSVILLYFCKGCIPLSLEETFSIPNENIITISYWLHHNVKDLCNVSITQAPRWPLAFELSNNMGFFHMTKTMMEIKKEVAFQEGQIWRLHHSRLIVSSVDYLDRNEWAFRLSLNLPTSCFIKLHKKNLPSQCSSAMEFVWCFGVVNSFCWERLFSHWKGCRTQNAHKFFCPLSLACLSEEIGRSVTSLSSSVRKSSFY